MLPRMVSVSLRLGVLLAALTLAPHCSSEPDSVMCMLTCFIQQNAYCSSVPDVGGCPHGQELVKDGAYCKCCDACFTIAREGDICNGNAEYAQYIKCAEGLTCDFRTQKCLNYTSLIDFIKW